MSKKARLFNLIKSMTTSEKRHFKLSAKAYGGADKKYLLLFDEMDRAEAYSEITIKENLKDEINPSSFSKQKAYLEGLIIDDLMLQERARSPVEELRYLIANCRLLLDRGLIDHAWSIFKKAQKEHDSIRTIMEGMQLNILHRRLAWSTYFLNSRYKEMYPKLVQEFSDQFELFKKYEEFNQIGVYAFMEGHGIWQKKEGDYKQRLTDIAGSSKVADKYYDNPELYKSYSQARANVEFVENSNVANRLKWEFSLWELFHKYPKFLNSQLNGYFSLTGNIIYSAYLSGDKKMFEIVSKKFIDYITPKKNEYFNRYFLALSGTYVNLIGVSLVYDDLNERVYQDCLKLFVQYGSDINNHIHQHFFENCSSYHFKKGEYDKCIDVYLKSLNKKSESPTLLGLRAFMHLRSSIGHYENGNFRYCTGELDKLLRYYSSSKAGYDKEVGAFLNCAVNLLKDKIRNSSSDLSELKLIYKNRSITLDYFCMADLYNWLVN